MSSTALSKSGWDIKAINWETSWLDLHFRYYCLINYPKDKLTILDANYGVIGVPSLCYIIMFLNGFYGPGLDYTQPFNN